MKNFCTAGMLVILLVLTGVFPAQAEVQLLKGQTLYVPVYSHILHGNLDRSGHPDSMLLSSMLALRNTDPASSIRITQVDYYNNDGKLIRKYYSKPVILGPLASADVFVEHKDQQGGTGANFMVVWEADEPVNPPVIETINSYLFGNQSLAFVSPSREVVPHE